MPGPRGHTIGVSKNEDDCLAEKYGPPAEDVSQGWYSTLTFIECVIDDFSILYSPPMLYSSRQWLT